MAKGDRLQRRLERQQERKTHPAIHGDKLRGLHANYVILDEFGTIGLADNLLSRTERKRIREELKRAEAEREQRRLDEAEAKRISEQMFQYRALLLAAMNTAADRYGEVPPDLFMRRLAIAERLQMDPDPEVLAGYFDMRPKASKHEPHVSVADSIGWD